MSEEGARTFADIFDQFFAEKRAVRMDDLPPKPDDPELRAMAEMLERALRPPTATKDGKTVLDIRIGPLRTKREPRPLAEFLLTAFLKPSRVDAANGDLNERFADDQEKLGRSRAVRLYWARTLRSLWPLLRRAIGKAVKWGAVIAAMRRLF